MEGINLMDRKLGRLQKIDLREVWKDEARDFTPWLAEEENLRLLGDTIGIELELIAQEQRVGLFRADIICKDTIDGSHVLIENQLEPTDHNHLGQILTYTAGLEAVTIIWIAKKFTEEHRAALDWLNGKTAENINFLGLEIELWQIGDSDIAPKFNIVSKSNDWVKVVSSKGLTETMKNYVEYWTQFVNYVNEKGSFIKTRKPQPTYFMSMALGRTGFNLTAGRDYTAVAVEVTIGTKEFNEHFSALLQDKAEIESEIGEELEWNPREGKQYSSIGLRRNCNPDNKDDWPAQHTWFLEKLEKLHRVFSPRIRNL